MRTEPEIRAEFNRMKTRLRELRSSKDGIEAAYAAAKIEALAFVLGETATVTTRVKI